MKKVVVYSQPGCPPCDWAKTYLTERGVPFTVRDVSSDFSAQRELVGKYKSRSTPTIVVGDEVMVGFDPDRLEKMLAE
jgi:glutaredoxin-like YruB-family protein